VKLKLVVFVAALSIAGCTCEPLVNAPDGGKAGGTAGGTAGGGTGGGAAGGEAGGDAGGGAGGGNGGGSATTQFTQFVRDLIDSDTSETTTPRADADYRALPDDAPIVYPPSFFDGGQ
jgi:hypothetical protein